MSNLMADKTMFALFLANRGMFPGSLQTEARAELPKLLQSWGHETIMMDEGATKFGGVETPAEGKLYAKFLEANKGKVGGVILTLPNFGDENGAVAGLKNAGVPIFVHAWPDDLDKMAPELRRDSFCGKFSVMDVFWQNGIQYTIDKPHTVALTDPRFKANIENFDSVCRIVGGMKDMTLGALGARTTEFKTVRFDEIALQRHGITVESFDLSEVFGKMKELDTSGHRYTQRITEMQGYSCWEGVPSAAMYKLARLSVVLDDYILKYDLDCLALRCWVEMEQQLHISPCVILSMLNERGIAAACEVDVCNAVMMHALQLASGFPATCLDWNNNYGDDDDKCILFHCGPVPASLMTGKGRITDHAILRNVVGEGNAFGCNVGRIKPGPITFASMVTDSGKVKCYVGEGEITDDPIAEDFFGCAGVAEIPNLQDVLMHVGRNGFRHHVSVTAGHTKAAMVEALENYLSYDVVEL